MQIDQIVFDLDGTLIDSSASILAGFQDAFSSLGLSPQRPLAADLIGPPLLATLALLAGSDDPGLLDRLAAAFKSRYDSDGYRLTTVYPGIDEMLRQLHADGIPLHIATNKRIFPTRRILEHLNWAGYFHEVYALDLFQPPLASKSLMLEKINEKISSNPEQVLYVGDRMEDGTAAEANGMPFALAVWGYGLNPATPCPEHWQLLDKPQDIRGILIASR